MRRITSSLLLAGLATLPAFSQSHLNVAPGKIVQVYFNHKAGDPANVFSTMIQVTNDGTTGLGFTIPFGQALVMTDISVQSSVPSGYVGSMDGFVSLRWYFSNAQAFTTLYADSFKAGGTNQSFGFTRTLTAGRIFASSAHTPSFNVTTPWDPTFANLTITTTGYLIAYP